VTFLSRTGRQPGLQTCGYQIAGLPLQV
jgi:hypothetical protein